MATNNILKYTDLDFPAIITQINNNIASDPNFDNVRDSAISQSLIEIFSACTDMITYYLERRAEECYLDTAKLSSSIILLSRQLGYVVTRPIPASSTLRITLKGSFLDLNGMLLFTVGDKLQIPINSAFTFGGNSFVLKSMFSYTFQNQDIYNMANQGSAYTQDLVMDDNGNDITIVQGEIREQVISGETNPQIGQKFQLYKLGDTEFSNIYGDQDYSPVITRVWVGNSKTDPNEYEIDRRSLINYQNINNGNFLEDSKSIKICVIRTAIDGDVELKFGDGKFADYGAQSNSDDIFIQYLATIGSKANQVGVINNTISFGGNIYNKTGIDITNLVSFKLNSNIIGGSDIESNESIKSGTPAIYSSLDRLVSKSDYINFLQTLTSPISVNNAIVWGEQDEILNTNSLTNSQVIALKKLFNVVLFSCVGSLYEIGVSPHYVKTPGNGLEEAVLDVNFQEDEFTGQSYFNVYTSQNIVQQLKKYVVNQSYFELDTLTTPTPTSAFNSAYLTAQYGSNAVLVVNYNSVNLNDDMNTEGSTNIVLDFTNWLNPVGDNNSILNEIATKIQTKLQTIIDQRGGSIAVNNNYNQNAFPNVLVTYNGTFNIVNDVNDPCYVSGIVTNNTDLSTNLVTSLGFYKTSLYPKNKGTNVELSGKVTSVISQLNEKAQPTISHVYMSPIIQNFDLTGNVYVSNLFDIATVKTQVEDAVYEWLNSNANYNAPIYISNIAEIIENNSGVKYSNIQLTPESVIGTPFYDSNGGGQLASIINSPLYGNQGTAILASINNNLNSFLHNNPLTSTTSNTINYNGSSLQNSSLSWNNFINERNFYSVFVNGVYNDLITSSNPNITTFVYSQDFFKVMSGIHKDLLVMIRNNMLNTGGNIDRENDSFGNYYKGGYSLGNEIVKVNIALNYLYSN